MQDEMRCLELGVFLASEGGWLVFIPGNECPWRCIAPVAPTLGESSSPKPPARYDVAMVCGMSPPVCNPEDRAVADERARSESSEEGSTGNRWIWCAGLLASAGPSEWTGLEIPSGTHIELHLFSVDGRRHGRGLVGARRMHRLRLASRVWGRGNRGAGS